MDKTYILRRSRRFLLISSIIASSALSGSGEVNFSILPVSADGDVSEDAAKVIYRKTEQILTRNSAAAAGAADVFAVEAKLTLTGESESSGLVRDIASVSGELQLVALNKVDGAKYYSVTVPLSAAVKGGKAKAVTALANSIKPTDAVFTRFVRLAREKVDDYYSEHCEEVIGRAKSIAAAGGEAIAMVYLTGVPASAPCHEEAVEFTAILRQKLKLDREAAEDREDERAARKAASNQPDNGQPDNSEPNEDIQEMPQAVGLPAEAPVSAPEIYIDDPSWSFKVISAEYLPSSHKIKITTRIEYIGKKSNPGNINLGFREAIDKDGDSYDRCYVEGAAYRPFPNNVPVTVVYLIDDVRSNPGILAFIGLSVDYKRIEIRNLEIK